MTKLTATAEAKKKRPVIVTVLTWLLILGALLNIVLGVLSIYASEILESGGTIEILASVEDERLFSDAGEWLVEGTTYLVVGIVQAVFAIGFWRQRKWAWVGEMTWQALRILLSVATALAGNLEPFSLALSILLIFLLNQSDVRRIFGIRYQPNESTPITPLNAFDSN